MARSRSRRRRLRLTVAGVVVLEAMERGARAALLGEPRDDVRHAPRLVVKAVTFHQLHVWESGGVWQADVFLDI
jgi:SHS2 domain-containing protein